MEPLATGDPSEVGGYRLIGVLGMGGMGRVFLGRAADGTVASVKVIHPDRAMDAEYMRRFKREARAAQAVSNPYIASVIRAGVDDRPPWLATVFVPGPTLHEVVLAGPLPTGAVWRLADGLAQALQAVHAGGLVHRDLKPANVLLASNGPRLIDFGIAKGVVGAGSSPATGTITQVGVIIGTPGFMSPEQVSGRLVGSESDVFSLGAMIAFAASGRMPFGDGASVDVLTRVLRDEPDLSGVIPADLRGLLAGCLAKDPRQRPALYQVRMVIAAGQASSPMSWPGSFWPDPLAAMVSLREDSYRQYLASRETVSVHWQPPAPVVPGQPGPASPGSGKRARSGANVEAAEQARRGDRLCARREFAQAEDAFRESIRLHPDPVVHVDLGRVLAQLGRFMEAEEQFRRAVKLAPDYIEPRQHLCRALYTMNRHNESADACEEATRLGGCCGIRQRLRPPAQGRP
ncbi:MAG TPA: protein kinase [Trebonia sp.]|jgi:serine/threonine protein kinase|nr:protein kinase [Trebonia sp.]